MGKVHPDLYEYEPSKIAAILFIALFSITTILHIFQMFRARTWYLIPLCIGGIFEVVGYQGRAHGSDEAPDFTLGPFIQQALLILIAPALFAASIYMGLGRIILLADGESRSPIRQKWLTKIFVLGDVISFLTQGAGGGIMSGDDPDRQDLGRIIIIIGLFIQVLFFGVFMIVGFIFDTRMRKNPTAKSLSIDVPWRKHIIVLFTTSLLIFVRSIFRVIEYLQGHHGYILSHEVFLYIFDAVLMLLVLVIFNCVHPSEVKALLRGGKYVTALIKVQMVYDIPKAGDRESSDGIVLGQQPPGHQPGRY